MQRFCIWAAPFHIASMLGCWGIVWGCKGLHAARVLCELPAQLSWQQCCHMSSGASNNLLGCQGYVLHVPVRAAVQGAAGWATQWLDLFAFSHTRSTHVCTWQPLPPFFGCTRVSLCVSAFLGRATSTGLLWLLNQGIALQARASHRQFGGDMCVRVLTQEVQSGKAKFVGACERVFGPLCVCRS